MSARPVVLAIAGSDSGGGAGIQMDLRAIWALGCFGTSAVTCVTSQNLEGVSRLDPVPREGVEAQIEAVATGFSVRAVKTGMLYSREIIETVAASYDRRLAGVPLVVDPVVVATSGARLLREDAVQAYTALFRRARVVTPNLDELAVLGGGHPSDPDGLERSALALAERLGCAVLAKGGHLEGPAVDVLADGSQTRRWASARVTGVHTHGSGCAYASAVAAGLARGLALEAAVGEAKAWLQRALRGAVEVEARGGAVRLLGGPGPVTRA